MSKAAAPPLAEIEARPVGLREQAKTLARTQLVDAAMALFEERGFDATTVNDVVRETGISQRTFFRYFPTKESVVIDLLVQEQDDLGAILLAMPGEMPTKQAISRALIVWSERHEKLALRLMRLAAASPQLLAAVLARHHDWESNFVAAIMQREPAIAPQEARLWAMIALNASRLCWHLYDEQPAPKKPIAVLIEGVLGGIEAMWEGRSAAG